MSCAVPTLCELLKTQTDVEVLSDYCWALSSLSERGRDVLSLIAAQMGRKFTQLLATENFSIQVSVIHILGNFASEDLTQYVIDIGGVDCLLALLSSPKKVIRKECGYYQTLQPARLPK